MSLKHENRGSGGGGGQSDITLVSSRNTITCDPTSTGWDINVANEEALRYVIHNFKEFMEAVVDIGQNRYASKTSCVMQLVNDIDMTSPTQEDEDLYKVDGAKLIDIANKKYNFRKIFTYTTILCDGTRRTLQLTFPDGGSLDTWTFGAEWLRFTNVSVGGGITSYNKLHGTSYHVSSVVFSRYLLESTGNLNYGLTDCEITCCGAPDSSFNPFIREGSGSNRPSIYHTRIDISGCSFWHGADPSGNIWGNCNAPIVIYSTYAENYERSIKVKQLIKSVSTTSNETGVPNIQVWTVDPSSQDYATIAQVWTTHPWQTTSDGTSLVSCQIDGALLLKTRMAVNDIYLQGTPFTQGNPPTEDWVSLVSLLQNPGRQVIDSPSLEYFIGQIHGNDNFVKVDWYAVFERIFELSNNFIFFDPHGHIDVTKTLYLIPIPAHGDIQLCGLLYGTDHGEYATCQTIYAKCDGGGNFTLKNSVKGASVQGLKSADIEVIEYNGDNYLALVKNFASGDLFLKGYSNVPQEDIDDGLVLLYYDGTRQKWYSDSALTQEVSFTVLETSGRFPASLDFGGNTSQVVAGDGTFLNWGDKLGYWIGETADLPPVGSRDANNLYITTDY